jgi:hypothetical protein
LAGFCRNIDVIIDLMRKLSFLLISLLLSIIPSFYLIHAQYAGINDGGDLTVNMSPTYPAPGDRVSLELEMSSENLDASYITWYQDGKVVQQGNGKKQFYFTAPAAAKQTIITINISTQSGASFSKNIVVRPASIDIIWEGVSYTPPFYKGRSLWGAQGEIRLLAIPSFGDSSKLVYDWKINGEILQNQSGYGRDSISFTNNGLGGNLQVEVTATDPVTDSAAKSYLVVPQIEPSIVFYENNPLYGIVYDRAIHSVDLKNNEMAVIASPFNLFIGRSSDISYKWKVNGNIVDAFGRSITLRKPDNASGSSSVSLEANNAKRMLQLAEGGFLVQFK